ncbi:hypothetical protein MM817_03292 [Acidibacillus sp. S0AB]|uniref:Uncharacterized protein n=1 Tax=Sulfoacidibacillus ferrooxidans TaxID=2005001 RepID=A0A9X2AG05_9BACL|nr:hypothetical protein [Sulfoacidibacillus ferrooxidans]
MPFPQGRRVCAVYASVFREERVTRSCEADPKSCPPRCTNEHAVSFTQGRRVFVKETRAGQGSEETRRGSVRSRYETETWKEADAEMRRGSADECRQGDTSRSRKRKTRRGSVRSRYETEAWKEADAEMRRGSADE